jgi:signal transduction histidine kinase/ActR/RegA family two-component response regulator
VGKAAAEERSAGERITSWRVIIIGTLAKTIAVVSLPLAIWISVDAGRLGLSTVRFAVLAFAASSIGSAIAPLPARTRAWWVLGNFVLVAWATAPIAGAQAGIGSIILLVAVLGALVLGSKEAVVVLGILSGGLLMWASLLVVGTVPRPPRLASDAGVPVSLLRSILVSTALAGVALLATSHLIQKLTRTVLESERLLARKSGEIAAREEEERRRRSVEDELIRAQKLEVIGRMAGGVAHDVNNNLTVALAGAELIERSSATDEKARRLGASIREACENASMLTRQLLALGRRELTRPEVVRVGAVLPRVERLLHSMLGRGVALSVSIPPDLPPVLVDPRQLEQVLLNIAINARDALPHGGEVSITADHGGPSPAYSVATADRSTESPVRIHVADDGPGIEDADLPKLFEFFFTTKGPESGTGLGLAIARAFAESNGGRIGVRTEHGRGSIFTIELPSAPARHIEPSLPRKTPSPATILVVDDDVRVRAGMTETLASAGYDVLEAGDGVEALARARETPRIDLLCTDAIMPHLGGEDLIPRFKALHEEARVLVCSAYVHERALQDLVHAGHYAALPKPFSPAELRDAVARALAAPSDRMPPHHAAYGERRPDAM